MGNLPINPSDGAQETLVCDIDSLSNGIFGVARTSEGVLLVPGTAPGDRARVRITKKERGVREAEVVEILEPSPARRRPPCRWIPECGGCGWQHVGYETQLAAKETNLRREIARATGLPPGEIPIRRPIGSAEWGYRHRINLRVGGEQRLGFYQHRSHRLVEIDRCEIADDTVNRGLEMARRWLSGVSTTVRRLEIASAGDGRIVIVANAEGPFRHDGPYHETFLRRERGVSGVVLFGSGWRRSFGDARVSVEIEAGMTIETEGGFTQVNPVANRQLVAVLLELAAPVPTDRVLDLYAGAGNLTLPLARRTAEVVGVEIDAQSAGDARRNADRLALRNCRFVQAAAAGAARSLAREGERFSLVVLDPPRSGAADVLGAVVELEPERIVYVSCNPATFARDVARLGTLGYRLVALQPIDLFPQTHHLEVVARLDRGAELSGYAVPKRRVPR